MHGTQDSKNLFTAYMIKHLLNRGYSESLSYYVGSQAVSKYLSNLSVFNTVGELKEEVAQLSAMYLLPDDYDEALTDVTLQLEYLYFLSYGYGDDDNEDGL